MSIPLKRGRSDIMSQFFTPQENQRLLQWEKALRSGKYKQGRYALCQLTDEAFMAQYWDTKSVLNSSPDNVEYCCLGVLATELDQSICWKKVGSVYVIQENDEEWGDLPPERFFLMCGLPSSLRGIFGYLNDREQYTFSAIADEIRSLRLLGHFTKKTEKCFNEFQKVIVLDLYKFLCWKKHWLDTVSSSCPM